MELDRALYFKNRDEWREWLEKNHSKEDVVWLIHYKKDSGKTGVSHEDAVEEAICFGWIDGKLKRIDKEKFILRYSPRKADSVWSKINKEKAKKMIKLGRMTNVGLAKIEEAKKTGFWQKAYTNIKKERMPPDLKRALMKNKKAWNNFQNFANSYRNMYIGWVVGAKTDETRKKRIEKVVKQSLQKKKLVFL
jgi:uncharacterized protein YdeI (YjbR/CyaY-like superfamily)